MLPRRGIGLGFCIPGDVRIESGTNLQPAGRKEEAHGAFLIQPPHSFSTYRETIIQLYGMYIFCFLLLRCFVFLTGPMHIKGTGSRLAISSLAFSCCQTLSRSGSFIPI